MSKEFPKKEEQLEDSRNIYNYPFSAEFPVKIISDAETVTHQGPYRGSIDFSMPLGTAVFAPFDAEVVNTVDVHDKFGPSEEFVDFLNYITLRHTYGEFSQLAHLQKGSVLVKAGDEVRCGQQIAVTGQSGFMTEPHLHFFVFKRAPEEPYFKGLKIKFTLIQNTK